MSSRFSGVLTAIITPFTSDGRIDKDVLVENVDYLVECGVDGFYVCGTTGQGPLMSKDERLEVIRTVLDHCKGRKVIAQVGTLNINDVIDVGREALDMGVDHVAIVAPYYYQYDREALKRYYTIVSESLKTPVFLYNIPSATGVNLNPELVHELSSLGLVAGIKDSSGYLEQIVELIELSLGILIFNGPDHTHYYALTAGVDGIVSGVSNVVPKTVVSLYRNVKEGNMEKARKIQYEILKLLEVFRGYPQIAVYHAAIELMGRRAGKVKPPLRDLDEKEKAMLKEDLELIGVLS